MHKKVLAAIAGILLTSVSYAATAEKPKSQESADMARAIAFERQKAAAAARQAQIEAKRSSTADRSANNPQKSKQEKK